MVALAFTSQLPCASRLHILVRDRSRVGGEFPDDLLEDVLERDQACDIAVFVDHEGEAPARALELRQLLRQRRAFGHEVGLTRCGQIPSAARA